MTERIFSKVLDSIVTLGVPVEAIDYENRIVRGFATLDNLDRHKDIVLASASIEAFKNFTGGIREMHQPLAVGKVIDFQERMYVDESGEIYTGIYVSVYISKGAESTWQKVIDGTLKAFSIQGPIIESHKEWREDLNDFVQVITKYGLNELSLVDNPGNQLALICLAKSIDGKLEGQIAETTILNVFWCEDERIAVTSQKETLDCVCGKVMKNAGWIESADREEIKKALISKGMLIKEGGSNTVTNTETVVDETAATELENKVDVAEATEIDFETVTKTLDRISADLQKNLANEEAKEAALVELKSVVDTIQKNFEEKMAELLQKHEGLATEFAGFKDDLRKVEKQLDTVDNSVAMRKSVDADQLATTNRDKSLWDGGAFSFNNH